MPLSKHGQQLVANYMYQKGKEFVGAAILLKRHGGFTHVYSHLLCQGVELILKSVLIFKDYNRFKKPIKKRIGHNLVKLVDIWKVELNQNRVNSKFYQEIKEINEHYKTHGLRYGSLSDIFISPDTVRTNEILRQLKRIIEKTDKAINKGK